jgi:mono/diheme cytochrome c family protein
MKKVAILALSLSLMGFIFGCGGGSQPQQTPSTTTEPETKETETQETKSDDAKGIGPITQVTLNTPLDKGMVKKGQEIYELKCSSCHKLDNTKLVGPGWKGVTGRRKPEWIMNFVTNVDEMLNKDAQAMALLEECLVRMPNQNLSEQDARSILEFMRHNDGEK